MRRWGVGGYTIVAAEVSLLCSSRDLKRGASAGLSDRVSSAKRASSAAGIDIYSTLQSIRSEVSNRRESTDDTPYSTSVSRSGRLTNEDL